MTKAPRARQRGEEIRRFIIDNLKRHPTDIARFTGEHFGISRQAVHLHLKRLVAQKAIVESGATRGQSYELAVLVSWSHEYEIKGAQEDVIWREDVRTLLAGLPDNAISIWEYCVTEIVNNAIDHSGGTHVTVYLRKTAADTMIFVEDDGIGIFKKIQTALNLLDEKQAILELSKGKLTTDPAHHSGQGIFFTSRLVDRFAIFSGETYFGHGSDQNEDWIFDNDKVEGTVVVMRLSNHTTRTESEIFDVYSSGDNYGFTKTIVPVKIAKYGNEGLVSRSQAKRLLARFEQFEKVILDFEGVDSIGQAFADQIFRVFVKDHPNVSLTPVNANQQVMQMIRRAQVDEPASLNALFGTLPNDSSS